MKGRCIHQEAGTCPSCLAFHRLLVGAVANRNAVWKRGVIATLSKGAGAAR